MVFDLSLIAASATGAITNEIRSAIRKGTSKLTKGIVNPKPKPKPLSDAVKEASFKDPSQAYTSSHKSESSSKPEDKPYDSGKQSYSSKPDYATAALFLPLVVSGALLTWLMISKKAVQAAGQLSPPGKNILFYIVLAFTALYALFLILAFIGKKKISKKAK